MYVQTHIDDYSLILQALMKLQQENRSLKSQLETEKLHRLIGSVSNRIDEWLDKPYHGMSERQDIESFSEEIIKYIDSQLRT